jgi:hypothetical protein
MNRKASVRISSWAVALAATLSAPTAAHAQMPGIGSGSPWVLAPYFFPRGALIAFLEGDPNQAMPFRVELAFPRGYRMQPHFHSNTIHVQVKQGGLRVGVGDRLDLKKTQLASDGDTATVPARAHYYYVSTAETIISVTGTGPFPLDYVNVANDPSRTFPYRP